MEGSKVENKLFETIKRYKELLDKQAAGPLDQAEFTEAMALSNLLSPNDVVGYLISLVDAADNLALQAMVCRDTVDNFIEEPRNPCNEFAKKYQEIRHRKVGK